MSKEKSGFINWSARVTNSGLSAFGGYIMSGPTGAACALLTTVADEILMNHSVITKHYLTSTALWTSIIVPVTEIVIEMFPEYSAPLYLGAVTAASTIAYYSHDPLDAHNKIGDVVDSLSPVIKLFDEHDVISTRELIKLKDTLKTHPLEAIKLGVTDLLHLVHNKPLTTLGANSVLNVVNIAITSSFYKYIGNDGTTMLVLTLLYQNPEAKILELSCQGIKIAGLFFGHDVINSVISFVKNYLQDNLKKSIQQKTVEDILLNEKHLQHILKIDGIDGITLNLTNDFNNLLSVGLMKFDCMTSNKAREFLAFERILEIAPESMFVAQCVGFFRKKINDLMQKKYNEFSKSSSEIESKNSYIISDLSKNFINAVFTGSTELIKEKYSNNIENRSNNAIQLKFFEQMQNLAFHILGVTEKIIEICYYGHKVISGQLRPEQLPLLKTWITDVSSMLQGGAIITFSQGNIAQERVKKILDALLSPYEENVIRSYNDENKITFKNYILKIKDEQRLKIDLLELVDDHIAICGISGLGKTSMLKDMKGCLTYPLSSSGEISLPKTGDAKESIMFIDQNLYIPATVTLFEAITLRSVTSLNAVTRESLKSQIINLFKELKIDEPASTGREDTGLIYLLDDSNYKTDSLSGGQKKKIGIIKAIINKPAILIMDEVFTGLDYASLLNAQKLLSTYLPDTKMIIVDHEAKSHNSSSFYDIGIEIFANGWQEIKLDSVPLALDPMEISILGENMI